MKSEVRDLEGGINSSPLNNSPKANCYFAEFLGTALFVAIGCGSSASVLFNKESNIAPSITFGIAYGVAVLLSYSSSGAHLNPAVTIAMCAFKRIHWKKVPGYIACQLAGAFIGALLALMNYLYAFNAYDGGHRQITGVKGTGDIFVSVLHQNQHHVSAFYTEVVGAFILILIYLFFSDKKFQHLNTWAPVTIGATTAILIEAFNAYLNPARDLSGRFLLFLSGWGLQIFTYQTFYFWVPLVAPTVGTLLGGAIYYFCYQRNGSQ